MKKEHFTIHTLADGDLPRGRNIVSLSNPNDSDFVFQLVDDLSDTEVRDLMARLEPRLNPLSIVRKAAMQAVKRFEGKTLPRHLRSAIDSTAPEIPFFADHKRTSLVDTRHKSGAKSSLPHQVSLCPKKVRTAPLASIETIRQILATECVKLEASSCTLYVRDPYWTDELRLLAWPGVKFPETMHGFLNQETSRAVVLEGPDISFVDDAASDFQRRNNSFVVPRTISAKKRHLFGDFVEREGVISSARLAHRVGASVEAVLFVNYGTRKVFSPELKMQIEKLLDRLVPYLDGVSRELQLMDAPTVQQMISIMKPSQGLASVGLNQQQSLQSYFHSLLDAAMDASGLSPATGLGTIHLYQEEAGLLALAAHRGTAEHIELAQCQYASQGIGVISWVALRSRPLIIHDFRSSLFKQIHVRLKKGTRAEIAVPMLADGKLLGVFNLESVKPGSFSDQHVRAISYVANIAAGAVRLYQEIERNDQQKRLVRDLVECFLNSTDSREEMPRNIPNVAHVLSQWLHADRCHIWHYDSAPNPRFYDALTTYIDFDPKSKHPRPNGWSEYVCRMGQCIWITSIRSIDCFEVFFWDQQDRIWRKDIPITGIVPERLNNSVIKGGIASEFGVPIFARDRCIGIAWVEYKMPGLHPPHRDQMPLANAFARGAGLIMQCVAAQRAKKSDCDTDRTDYGRRLLGIAADLCASRDPSQTLIM